MVTVIKLLRFLAKLVVVLGIPMSRYGCRVFVSILSNTYSLGGETGFTER